MCANKGLAVDTLKAGGARSTPEQMDAALSAKKYAAVTATHVDTSTGVVVPQGDLRHDEEEAPRRVLIVDAVAAAAGAEAASGQGIDVLLSVRQKAPSASRWSRRPLGEQGGGPSAAP